MERQPFITPAMSIVLDLVRALAALAVVIGHMIDMDLYTGPFPLDAQMAHNAVVVFFVLSGLVIAHSVAKRQTEWSEYAIARVARIVPVAWFAVIASTLLFAWSRAAGLPEQMMPPYDRADFQTVVLPLVFLSESGPGNGLVWNPPFWSLCYEVWFYALFGASVFLKGRNRVACLALFALIAGWKILLMMPIWLMGVALVRWSNVLAVRRVTGVMLLLAGLAVVGLADHYAKDGVFWLRGLLGVEDNVMGFSQFVLTDTAMGAGIAAIFVGIRPFADRLAAALRPVERQIAWLAGSSFTLYVLHNPMLLMLRAHGIGAGENLGLALTMFALVVLSCGMLAPLVEHRSPQVRATLRNLARPRQSAQPV